MQPSTKGVHLCKNEEQGVAIAGVAKVLETALRRVFHGREDLRITKQFGGIRCARVRFGQ